jgi:hypothetical protein
MVWEMDIWEFGHYCVCTPTRICKPNYWTQIANPTECLLTWQRDQDFMIWCQKSVRKMIMPDCKNPHSIFFSNQIQLWTLIVHLYSRLSFFFVLLFFFLFVATMIQHPNSRPIPYADFLTQRQHYYCHVVLIGFYTDNPQNVSVSCWYQTPVPCLLAIGLLFGAPLASV